MPVKLTSKPGSDNEARIEIVPLIDIMFFLLASFMLVSLGLIPSRTIPVRLPVASTGKTEAGGQCLRLAIDRMGTCYLEKQAIGANELFQRLAALRGSREEIQVSLSGDRDARHGDMIRILDLVRSAGIQKVAFETGSSSTPNSTTP